jgi:hypothetical protein
VSTLVSSWRETTFGTEMGEGGHPGETWEAGKEDLAYKGLRDIVP